MRTLILLSLFFGSFLETAYSANANIEKINNSTIWLLLFVMFFGMIAFIHRSVTISIQNKELQNKVNDKTRELQLLNENLQNLVEEKSKELLEKESLLNQQTKMAAMGEMLENIAHQWRQPLSIISTVITSMKLKKEMNIMSEAEFLKDVETINNSVQHLSSTIDDFRNFFKPKKNSSTFKLNSLINKLLHLLDVRLNYANINIIRNIENIEIKSYENELIQVLLNILNNSIDIFEDNNFKEKQILIDVYKKDLDVIISIKDSAGGIKDEFLSRVFEPYFTTKHKSQGTGIGLYMSLQIVSKHLKGQFLVSNSSFSVDQKEYFGANFTIKLPLDIELV